MKTAVEWVENVVDNTVCAWIRRVLEVFSSLGKMVFIYPEFHGRKDEDVEEFLEQMEIACISNQINDLA